MERALWKMGVRIAATTTAKTALKPEVINLVPQAARAAAAPLPSRTRVMKDFPR